MRPKLHHHMNLLRQVALAESKPEGFLGAQRLGYIFTALQLGGIAAILIAASVLQFARHEPPCPLCLLQRAGFLLASVGLLLNLRLGLRPGHYALVLLGAVFAAGVALRQISLHALPGADASGGAVFGVHFYTWSLLAAAAIIVVTTAALAFEGQYEDPPPAGRSMKLVVFASFALLTVLAAVNVVSVTLECGISQCPDNPVHYRLLR